MLLRLWTGVLVTALTLQSCAAPSPRPHALQNPLPLPEHLLIAPPDIVVRFRVSEQTPVLPDPARSAEASKWATQALQTYWGDGQQITLLTDADLSEPQRKEQVGLYYQVAAQAFEIMSSRETRWRQKKSTPDFTIGPGLAELGRAYRAQAILFVVGQQTQANSAMNFRPNKGLVPPALTAGLVELRTGRLVWLSHAEPAGGQKLNHQTHAQTLVYELLDQLTGAG